MANQAFVTGIVTSTITQLPLRGLLVSIFTEDGQFLGTTYSLYSGEFHIPIGNDGEAVFMVSIYDNNGDEFFPLLEMDGPYSFEEITDVYNKKEFSLDYEIRDTGGSGQDGQDGQSSYTYIRYAANASGSSISSTASASRPYIGIKTTTSPLSNPNSPSHYSWMRYLGTDGTNGNNGTNGIGISSAEINTSGELVLTYTDATIDNLGSVIGPQGPEGPSGSGSGDSSSPDGTFVCGYVVDQNGSAMSGNMVRAYDKNQLELTVFPTTATTDSDGFYHIDYTLSELGDTSKTAADLVVKVFNSAGTTELQTSPTVINAKAQEEINLAIGASFTGLIEYEIISRKLSEPVGSLDLTTVANSDISSFASKYRFSHEQTAAYLHSKRLSDNTSGNQQVFYGLLRQEMPSTLAELLLKSKEEHTKTLHTSCDKNIIDPALKSTIDALVTELRGLISSKTLEENEGDNSRLNVHFEQAGLNETDKSQFMTAFSQFDAEPNEFWNQLESSTSINKTKRDAMRFSTELGAITSGSSALMSVLKDEGRENIKSTSQLASYTAVGWENLITSHSIEVPSDIEGEDEAEKRTNYARTMANRMEDGFPTAVFASRLQASDTESSDFDTFFTQNESFELGTTNIPTYMEASPNLDGIGDVENFTAELEGMQRIYRLAPKNDKFETVQPLWDAGLHSARAVTRLGEASFMSQYSETLGAETAHEVFNLASQASAVALNTMTIFGESFNVANPAVIRDTIMLNADTPEGIPNLETLFGPLDLCACKHCRSVYSPAAYLVDLLHWLQEIPTDPDPSTPKYPGAVNNTQKALFHQRRGEIGTIELTCHNTNTPLPYIDLVNEVLENAVAGTTNSYQTEGEAPALKAMPEHMDTTAYNTVKDQIYPWTLPYSLYEAEAYTYLTHLGAAPYRVAADVPAASGTMSNVNMAMKYLGIIELDRQLITHDVANLSTALSFTYGSAAQAITQMVWRSYGLAGSSEITELGNVRKLIEQAHIDYDTLLELLQSTYINPNGTTVYFPTSDCTLTTATLALSEAELCKFYRFWRLQKKMGWTVQELDMGLSTYFAASGASDINDACISALASMKMLSESTQTDVDEILTWWSNINVTEYNDEAAKYETIFINPAVNVPGSTAQTLLQLNAGRTQLSNATQDISTTNFKQFVLSATNLTATDFDTLVATELPTTKYSTIANLSHLYRVHSFVQAVGISVDDYRAMKQITGLQPITQVNTTSSAMEYVNPSDTMNFIEVLDTITEAGFSIEEIQYLLQNNAQANSIVAFDKTIWAGTMESLRTELKAIATDNAIIEGNNREKVTSLLPMLIGYGNWDENDVSEAIDIISGATLSDITTQGTFIDDHFVLFFTSLTAAKSKLTNTAHVNYIDPVLEDDRFGLTLSDLEAFITGTIIPNLQAQAIRETLAASFMLDSDVMAALLDTYVKDPLDSSKASIEVFRDSAFVSSTTTIDTAGFANLFNTGELLHKVARHLEAMEVKVSELPYLFTHGPGYNWFDIRLLGSAMASVSTNFPKWLNMVKAYNLNNGFNIGEVSLIDLMTQAVTSSTTDADIVAVTGWNETDLTYLVGTSGFDFASADTNFRKKEAWLLACAEAFKLLKASEVSAQLMVSWNQVDTNATTSEGIRNAAKSKHSNEVWLDVAPPLRDELRIQQRDALCDYLVAHSTSPDFIDRYSLFEHFLIDPDMDPCMMTTRVKLALSTVQLFVQRIMMNLEADLALTRQFANEWTWRKNYRVWEANRKVFLYPENWIEPELRDDQTDLFREMMEELLQTDVTMDTASRAYINYLGKLDKISELDVSQICIDSDDTVYAFARTKAVPRIYYYRKFVDNAYWTNWEKIEGDIEGDHLIPVVYNNRLMIFWPTFMEKSKSVNNLSVSSSASSYDIQQPEKYMEVRINWSELKDGKWTPKTQSSRTVDVQTTSKQQVYFYSEVNHLNELKVIPTVLYHSGWNTDYWIFKGCNKDPEVEKYPPYVFIGGMKRSGSKNQFEKFPNANGNLELKLWYHDNPYTQDFWWMNLDEKLILESSEGTNKVTLPHEINTYYSQAPFFYEDTKRTFFVKPESKIYDLPYYTMQAVRTDVIKAIPAYGSSFEMRGNNIPVDVVEITDASFGPVLDLNARQFFVEDDSLTTLDRQYETVIQYTGNEVMTEGLAQIAKDKEQYYRFYPFYHNYLCLIVTQLNRFGVEGLLRPEPGRSPEDDMLDRQGVEEIFFNAKYQPTSAVLEPYPENDIDFSTAGGYAMYNWELFFHAPMMIANELSKNQKFEEAMKWYHFIFDPTEVEGAVPARFWRTKPFFNYNGETSIQQFMNLLNSGNDEMEQQVAIWRKNPFKPHAIARMRTVAYMKSVVMKYLDNLIAWGDQLFGRDSIESINEATQVYVLAAQILGRRPEIIERDDVAAQTFNDLAPNLDSFSNALVTIENVFSGGSYSGAGVSTAIEASTLDMLYFCIPKNEKLWAYWDTVADRLFKIRHCMNIQGVVRQLPMFQPPIDPGMLVKAAAGGIDIGSALADMNSPLAPYRYSYLYQKAVELVGDVKSFGGALLSALEKKDGEELAMLRNTQEIGMHQLMIANKELAIEDAEVSIEALEVTKKITTERYMYYKGKKYQNRQEQHQLKMLKVAHDLNMSAQITDTLAAALSLIPNFDLGLSGVFGSPVAKVDFGGIQLNSAIRIASDVLRTIASAKSHQANQASIVAGHDRRMEDWVFQRDQAKAELGQLQKQIEGAKIKLEIAKKDLENQKVQIENSKEVGDFMVDKYTNKELYSWMSTQISRLYFQAYKMAYDMAKRAEKAYRFELGLDGSDFIDFGYWDSLKKGLLSGERLHNDLKRLDIAYTDSNKREYELTKQVSLAMLSPEALMQLRETGKCDFDIPELLYDLDHPGQYFRRIKSVSLTIPCVVGPYTSVSTKLTLLRNRIRKNTNLLSGGSGNGYAYEINDGRFIHNNVGIKSIATSNAQGDSGMFEVNFNDSRFLPFEGAGAISSWRVELPNTKDLGDGTIQEFRQFDYDTISDVILTVQYTARDGGDTHKAKAAESLEDNLNKVTNELASTPEGLFRLVSLRHEFPTELHQFLHADASASQTTAITLSDRHFPHILKGVAKKARSIKLAVKFKDEYGPLTALQDVVFNLQYGDTPTNFENVGTNGSAVHTDPAVAGLASSTFTNNATNGQNAVNKWTITADRTQTGSITWSSTNAVIDSNGHFDPDAIEDIFLLINYTK